MTTIKVFVDDINVMKAARGEEFQGMRSTLFNGVEMDVPFRYITGLVGTSVLFKLPKEECPVQK